MRGAYAATVAGTRYNFPDLKTLLARATPLRSGDVLAGIAAADATERVAAQLALADLPLARFLAEAVVPYEADEVTRLILDSHDPAAFAPVASLTVGEFRDWLLSDAVPTLAALAPGPDAGDGRRRLQDHAPAGPVAVAAKCRVTTRFRNTIGLPGRLSTRLQPNHPTDDPRGDRRRRSSTGCCSAAGDAVIGINPATDSLDTTCRADCACSTNCASATTSRPSPACSPMSRRRSRRSSAARRSISCSSRSPAPRRPTAASASRSRLLSEARDAALSLGRGTVGDNVMYFETGQGSALSADAHHGVDQQTMEARAYAVARAFDPLLVNSVVGFIGPEYLFDGKQITRAGLEDHFCGKLLGLPMGVDVCYTNHAEADQDDMDALLTLLGVAGVHLHHGRAGRRRRDAGLSEHLVP